METTCLPFKAFPVTPEWITNLWQTDKVTADKATLLHIRAKKHVKQYTENVRAQTQLSRQLQVKAAKAEAVQALEAMKRPSVRLEAVDTLFMHARLQTEVLGPRRAHAGGEDAVRKGSGWRGRDPRGQLRRQRGARFEIFRPHTSPCHSVR